MFHDLLFWFSLNRIELESYIDVSLAQGIRFDKELASWFVHNKRSLVSTLRERSRELLGSGVRQDTSCLKVLGLKRNCLFTIGGALYEKWVGTYILVNI